MKNVLTYVVIIGFTLFTITRLPGCTEGVKDGGVSVHKIDYNIGNVHYIIFQSSNSSDAGIAVVNYTNDSLIALVRENVK